MNLGYLLPKLPPILGWIDDTISQHAAIARRVSSFQFPRLPAYFPDRFCNSTNVVAVPKVPVPPLSSLGLSEFSEFEKGDYAGITYKNTYFVRDSALHDESIHFHELVHVVQWKHLGPERFLLTYAAGPLEHGYKGSPLERMAYSHQSRFQQSAATYDVESVVRQELDALVPSVLAKAFGGVL